MMAESPLTESINQLTHLAIDHSVPSLTISLAAITIAGLSFVWSMIAHKREHHTRVILQAIERWDRILTACNDDFDLLLPDYQARSDVQRASYDAYNYQAWSLVNYIISNKIHHDAQFLSIVNWIVTFNRAWLLDNPFMFSSRNFWNVIQTISDEPLTVFRYKPLPTVDNVTSSPMDDKFGETLDWDTIAKDYEKYFIAPLSDEMVKPDPKYRDPKS